MSALDILTDQMRHYIASLAHALPDSPGELPSGCYSRQELKDAVRAYARLFRVGSTDAATDAILAEIEAGRVDTSGIVEIYDHDDFLRFVITYSETSQKIQKIQAACGAGSDPCVSAGAIAALHAWGMYPTPDGSLTAEDLPL